MSIGKYVKRYVKKFYFRLKLLDNYLKKGSLEEINNYLTHMSNLQPINLELFAKYLFEIFIDIKNQGIKI